MPGIASLVMTAGVPARVPDRIIAELHQRENRRGLIELPRLRPGDRIMVTRGPLEGLAGLCAGMTGRDRVLILLTLLGGARKVTLPAADVVAVRG